MVSLADGIHYSGKGEPLVKAALFRNRSTPARGTESGEVASQRVFLATDDITKLRGFIF
jgi:hypothetical protein